MQIGTLEQFIEDNIGLKPLPELISKESVQFDIAGAIANGQRFCSIEAQLSLEAFNYLSTLKVSIEKRTFTTGNNSQTTNLISW